MMMGSSIGFVGFTVILLLLSGGLVLYYDKKGYEKSGMKKEKKAASFLGWFNIVLGIAAYLVNWIYQAMI
jgi:hypothetical protein